MRGSVASAVLVIFIFAVVLLGVCASKDENLQPETTAEQTVQYYTQHKVSEFQWGEDRVVSLLTPFDTQDGVVAVSDFWGVFDAVFRFAMSSLLSNSQGNTTPPKIVIVDETTRSIIGDLPPINKGEPIGSHIMISSHWPEDILDVDMWIGYGIFIALLVCVPIIVGLVLQVIACHIWAFRKCGICGGSKPRKIGYTCTHRIVLRLVYVFMMALIAACAFGGIVSNTLFTTGSLGVIRTSIGIVDHGFRLFNETIGDLNRMNQNISSTFQATVDIVDGFSGILTPISNLGSDLRSGVDEIDAIEVKLNNIDSNLTSAKTELDYLFPKQLEFKCMGVPPPQMLEQGTIPLVNALRTQLDTARITLSSTVDSATGLSDSADQSLGQAQNTSIGFLRDTNTTITSQVSKILDTVMEYRELIENKTTEYMFGFDRHDIMNIVTYVEYGRTGIVTVFFLFALAIYVLGIFVIFTENKCGISVIALITWFCIIIYFVFAGLGFGIFSVTNEFCMNKEGIVQRYTPSTISNLTAAITNCSGDTTLFQVVRNELIAFFPEMDINITELLDGYRGQYESIRNQFNLTNHLLGVNNTFSGFDSDAANVFNSTGSLAQNITELNTLSENVTISEIDEIPYNFDIDAYQSKIDQVNAITSDISKVNPPLIFDADNFTLFDPYEAPINESDPTVQSDLTTLHTDTREMLLVYTSNTTEITDIRQSVLQYQQDIDSANSDMDVFSTGVTTRLVEFIPTQISKAMGEVLNFTTGFDNNITHLYNKANNILDGILDMERLTQCNWIGASYRSMENDICDRIIISISLMGVACAAMGLALFPMFILLLMLSKRVTRRFGKNPFTSLSENDEEGQQGRKMAVYREDPHYNSESGSYSDSYSDYSDYSR